MIVWRAALQRRSRFNVSIVSEVFMDLSIIIPENHSQEAFFSYTNLVPATSWPNHDEEGRGFNQQRRCWMAGLAGCVFWPLLRVDLLMWRCCWWGPVTAHLCCWCCMYREVSFSIRQCRQCPCLTVTLLRKHGWRIDNRQKAPALSRLLSFKCIYGLKILILVFVLAIRP